MRIKEILQRTDKGVSFEFFPPRNDKAKAAFGETVEILKAYNPLYVSMTYGAGGSAQDFTEAAVDTLLGYPSLTIMPHLTCIASNKETIRRLIDRYRNAGIENIMALRGDLPEESALNGSADFHFAIDLIRYLKKLNDFSIGAAVYPESHIESESEEFDFDYTKRKIDAGADFCVSQMFFDNSHFLRFMDKARKAGISQPILPGILPLTNIDKARQFSETCRVEIPQDIAAKLDSLKFNPRDMEKAGIEFTIDQCRDLISHGVKQLHFFTLNKPEIITTILDALSIL